MLRISFATRMRQRLAVNEFCVANCDAITCKLYPALQGIVHAVIVLYSWLVLEVDAIVMFKCPVKFV